MRGSVAEGQEPFLLSQRGTFPLSCRHSESIAKTRRMFDDGFGTVTRRPGVWKPLQTERVPYGARASLRLCGRGACDECPGPQS